MAVHESVMERECVQFANRTRSELKNNSICSEQNDINFIKDVVALQKLTALDNSVIILSPVYNNLSYQFWRNDCSVLHEQLSIVCSTQLSYMIQKFYNACTKQHNRASLCNQNAILEYQRNINSLDHNFQSSTTASNNLTFVNNSIIVNFYLWYFSFLNDYNLLENTNEELLKKINDLELKLKTARVDNNVIKICKNCLKLEEDLQKLKEDNDIISKKLLLSQTEKEKMVMNFATSEKRYIDAQRHIKLTEKKYQDIVKENAILQKRNKKTHDDFVKLNGEINRKNAEITQLRNQIEHHKDSDNSKDIRLKWAHNRIKVIEDAQKETQIKLNESLVKISELSTECDTLRSQASNRVKNVQKTEENKMTALDQQLKEQQARLILERQITEDSETSRVKLQKEFDSLLNKLHSLDRENNLLTSQVHNLQKECIDYKIKLDSVNSTLEKRNDEVNNLKCQVSQMEALSAQLKSKEQEVHTIQVELKRLYVEKAEFQADIEAYRQRENQMLDFTQKLTDKNVNLQCKYTNLQSKYHLLESNQSPLHQSIDKFVLEIKNLEYNLSSEKIKRMQDCDILAKYVAELLLYNQQLLHKLEDIEGENIILRKRYELTIREMNRELQLYHTKLCTDTLHSNSISSDNNIKNTNSLLNEEIDEMLSVPDKSSQDFKIYSSNLEKEELFDQIIKLQKINVKRAEKLDFLEEHSHALLKELQEKTKILQDMRVFMRN